MKTLMKPENEAEANAIKSVLKDHGIHAEIKSFHDTAFQPLEMRLACLLGRLFERAGSDTLDIIHQELAQELGTSRETISRLLKKLEQQECIILKRGQILMGENKQMPGTDHQII